MVTIAKHEKVVDVCEDCFPHLARLRAQIRHFNAVADELKLAAFDDTTPEQCRAYQVAAEGSAFAACELERLVATLKKALTQTTFRTGPVKVRVKRKAKVRSGIVKRT